MSDINLLSARMRLPKKALKYRPLAKNITVVMISGYILIVGMIIGFNLRFQNQEKKVNEVISDREREIEHLNRVESLQVSVKERMEALSKVYLPQENKIGLTEAMRRIESLITSEAEVDAYTISDYGNSVSLSGTVSSVTKLINVFRSLVLSSGKENGFDTLLISGLSKTSEGYQFQLSLNIQ